MMMCTMNTVRNYDDKSCGNVKGSRSRSVQGLTCSISSPAMKIPLPPRLWLTDIEDESSDDEHSIIREDGAIPVERTRVRSRFRHHKQRAVANVPVGIFWDIENCQVPRGCSAIDVVAAIRAKFLTGRREADFVVVCDVRKESPHRLQELNDAQVSLIHVCGTQKNAADEKLRQCMRRFGELHSAPASLLLISGDINFAADLCDFRHRKNMEVILVHKQNTSTALITCASSHYCYSELTAHLPRNPKISQTEEDEEPLTCEMEVLNLPVDHPPERISKRLRRLADNCGGKVLKVNLSTAMLRFPTPDHASRALKRMDGEDVFGRKISTRFARTPFQPAYSSDEGYSTAPANQQPQRPAVVAPVQVNLVQTLPSSVPEAGHNVSSEWALALQQLPAPTPPPLDFCPPPAPRPRKIRGTHGSASLDRSGCSSSNSGDDSRREPSQSRAVSPWNSSASFSEHSDVDFDTTAELTVSNLPPYEPTILQEMLTKLFHQYVMVVRVSVWAAGEGPLATVVLRSEWDARLAIARVHKRRLDNQWAGRRLELSLGRPSPAPNLDVLRARLRAILLDQKNQMLPLLRLRDAYASRHCCALTTSDIAKVKDTVIIHEGFGRMVQLIDLSPVSSTEMEEAPWKCHIHAGLNTGHEDGSRILQPVFIEISVLSKNVQILLENHGGILPLLSFVECYEASFPPLLCDARRGVPLELLLRNVAALELRDCPSRHLAWRARSDTPPQNTSHSDTSRSSNERERPRTAPALEPMLALFERELIDLLRTAPRCSIPFSKLIPAFHHHFGRQCRVADYGFTKLPDLLAALGNAIVVLGSGSYRVITISASAQGRRWTSDLVKLLNSQPGRIIHVQDIPQLYQATIGRPFTPVDYGVCTVEELMERVTPQSVIISSDGTVALPRRTPTPEERARTIEFAKQVVELLCYTPNLRMEFSRFVPAYHAHFGRQLRVAHYGCVKLVELLELIPDVVIIYCESSGERTVRLTTTAARAILIQRLQTLTPVPVAAFSARYAAQFGAPPLPDMLEVTSLEALVYAIGGCVDNGMVHSPGDSPHWANAALSACAVLSNDRSVARGSTEEYFVTAFRRLCNMEPNLQELVTAGVVEISDRHVRVSPTWRTVWRIAQILADFPGSLSAMEIFVEYTKRYGTPSNTDMGTEGLVEVLRRNQAVFWKLESEGSPARWALRAGVSPPRRDLAPVRAALEDYSVHDTPPGQKGSRVFESPKTNIWCSPPASALPTPTALLSQEKRRTRLAAQFDAV
ncbi:meiosis regulator and mRNA stability factor 1 isoform X2 [Epargyreus clarus]|uniref:meiosis regulator and mRNA stability factor 1 isoform X2 n=1 Tax=Epargyreus clarus TaxID=520877 RepID=UPI003C2F7B2D